MRGSGGAISRRQGFRTLATPRRSLCFPYSAATLSASNPYALRRHDSLPPSATGSECMSDAFYLSLGLGLIGVMALYAHALTRA
jgi:hypothetical protein